MKSKLGDFATGLKNLIFVFLWRLSMIYSHSKKGFIPRDWMSDGFIICQHWFLQLSNCFISILINQYLFITWTINYVDLARAISELKSELEFIFVIRCGLVAFRSHISMRYAKAYDSPCKQREREMFSNIPKSA